MFDSLSSNLSKIFDKLTGVAYLKESDVDLALRDIRIALLEADVSLLVVKEISKLIKEKSIGKEVLRSVKPGQMIIKIVQECITEILSVGDSTLNIASKPPAVILMLGLQGSGKTTSSAKLAYKLQKNGKKVYLASLDIYRPAAQEQLEILVKEVGSDYLPPSTNKNISDLISQAFKEARFHDVLIFDTAGRMQLDESLMQELKTIVKLTKPVEKILVVDSLTGQDAINIAQSFDETIKTTGIILTRVDSDARGGAALSISYITKKPIKFVGIGEKIYDLEEFHADRIASRILDMGDVVSLVEKAQELIGKESSEKLMNKIQKGQFDLNTLAEQMRGMKKMGGFASIMKLIPGVNKLSNTLNNQVNESMISKQLAIISSMTPLEKGNPKLLNASRKIRIAKGSGTSVSDINKLLKQFLDMQKMFKKFGSQNPENFLNSNFLSKILK